MQRYARLWPGELKVILHPGPKPHEDPELLSLDAADLPFALEVCRFGEHVLDSKLAGSCVVWGGFDPRIPNLTARCRSLGIPCVNVMEDSLRARLQRVRSGAGHRWDFVRSAAREISRERMAMVSVARAAGVQCNGFSAYARYRRLSPDAILYFDTPLEASMVADAEDLRERARRLETKGPLTLACFEHADGAGSEELIALATQLKRRGFLFRFLIIGEGDALERMRARVRQEKLQEVILLGALSLADELMPLLRREVDLFVSCHPQGEATYLAAAAAGVPIAGYENEALKGLCSLAPLGVALSSGRPDRLASRIVDLSREGLLARAHHAHRFAREHVWETTCERRVLQLLNTAERWQARAAGESRLPAATTS